MKSKETGTETYSVEDAVILLQDWFQRKAWRMSRENTSLIEDLAQEMSMGVLLSKGEHPLKFFKDAALWRARKFLRAESRQAGRRKRFGQLRHRQFEGDDTSYIEGLIDLQDALASRPEAVAEIYEYRPDSRASA